MDIDLDELQAKIGREITNAETFQDSEISASRTKAMEYYNGVMRDVSSPTGRSQYISKDVSNVIGWVLPSIMRVFTASNRMIDCLPENEQDEAFCQQSADYINYAFWRDNDGYKILWDSTFNALLAKDGIVKQFWDTTKKCSYHSYTNLTDEQIKILLSDDDVTLVSRSEGKTLILPSLEQNEIKPEEPMQPPAALAGQEMGAPVDMGEGGPEMDAASPIPELPARPVPLPPVMPAEQPMDSDLVVFDVKIKRETSQGRLKYQVIEPENFIIDKSAVETDDARFVAHKMVNVTRSDLIEMEFDRDIIDSLPAFNQTDDAPEKLARFNDQSTAGNYSASDTEFVDLYECYIKFDVNGDGISETVKAFYAGGHILGHEIWNDETPFDKIPCHPIPHRWSSDSLADRIMDLQKFKTVIGRQLFDNLYLSNNPQPIVEQDSVLNIDALINPGIGIPLFKKAGTAPIEHVVTPFIGDKAMMALEYLDNVIEMRTGVSRGAMALDPNTLQGQTATAVQTSHDASYSQVELIARNQAELGWKKVFTKSLKIIIKNQDRPRTIRLRNDWVEIDPRQWNSELDVVINIGLGTGSRDRDMAMLNNILQSQLMVTDRLTQAGMAEEALDMSVKINKTLIKSAEAAGIKLPETYFPDFTNESMAAIKQKMQQATQNPPPDPRQAALEADMQMKQQKMQMDMQESQAKLQMSAQDSQVKAAQSSEEMQQRLGLDRQRLQMEMQLRREQLIMEMQLKREQIVAEVELKKQTMQFDAFQVTDPVSDSVHFGGDPG